MARITQYKTQPATIGVSKLREITEPLKQIAATVGAKSAGTISDFRTNKKIPSAILREAFAKEYGIPSASWDDPYVVTATPTDPKQLASTKAEVEAQLMSVKSALADPNTAGSPATRARFTSEMRALLKLRSTIESQAVIDEHRLAESVVYRSLVVKVVDALAEFPEARDKVIEVLGAL